MSIDPQVIRSEPHIEIGFLLSQDVESVLERWSHRAVQEQPNAKRVHHAVLMDHLRDLLQSLGSSLAESQPQHTSEHYRPAVVHGEQRWEAGWSLAEVVRDYQILRLVILDYLEETLDRPIGYHEVLAIGLALDEAITASVVTYAKERDEYLAQLEQERTEEAKRVQQRLQEQSAQLQEADRRKDEFLALLAHELRNPLAPVQNAIEFLRLKCPPDSDLQYSREVIERQVEHLTHIVDDLLDVSRISQGKIKLQLEAVAVAAAVQRAAEIVAPLIDHRKHKLSITLPRDPVWLEADATRLIQVLANLLTNSAKYSDEAGEIWLIAERQEDEVVIKVRDAGVGIAPALLPRVFDPFVQEDRSLDRARGGLGLGLTLVRSLIELHGGVVQARSGGPGRGSEFELRLPALKELPAPKTEKKEEGNDHQAPRRRILVVDDNVDSARTLSLLLRFFGHEVSIAHDGPAALEMAKTSIPDVLLLDIGLPGMDGFEVARRVREDPTLLRSRLVAISGYGRDEDHRRSQEVGFDAHLVKPIDFDEIKKLLARLDSMVSR